jgi:hypothetical protein
VAAVGPVPVGTSVGHGPGGLLRRRQRVGLPAVRPGPRPRVPLGRGRHRRPVRLARVPAPVGRAVERARRPAQGALVRPDERPGQPRRGRQGVLVAPRRHTHPLLGAAALPLPAGRVPVRAARDRERPTRPRRARVRARGHRRPRREPVLRRHDHARQGVPGRRPVHGDRRELRSGSGSAPPRTAALVPQHLVVGTRRPATDARARTRRRRRRTDRRPACLPRRLRPGRRG